MDAGIKLENRKIKPKNCVFIDDVTDILRDEGYSKYWLRFRRNMHEIFDENDKLKQENQDLADKYNKDVYALESKVEEMHKEIEFLRQERETLEGQLQHYRGYQ